MKTEFIFLKLVSPWGESIGKTMSKNIEREKIFIFGNIKNIGIGLFILFIGFYIGYNYVVISSVVWELNRTSENLLEQGW